MIILGLILVGIAISIFVKAPIACENCTTWGVIIGIIGLGLFALGLGGL